MNPTINTYQTEERITRSHLDLEILSDETVVSRIYVRLANLNYKINELPYWIKEFVRFEKTENGFICRYSHRKSYTSIDYNGDLRPAYVYEIALLTRTPVSVLLNGNREDIDALPTDLDSAPSTHEYLAGDVSELFYRGLEKRIRKYRKLQGIPIETTASLVGITVHTMKQYEIGADIHARFIVMENLHKLCDLFDVDIDTFLLGEEPENNFWDWVQERRKRFHVDSIEQKPKPVVELQSEKPHITVAEIMDYRKDILDHLDMVNVGTMMRIHSILRGELAAEA